MVHADSALLPSDLKSKADFYAHLQSSLASLLSGQRHWITNLSNASSILHASLNAWRARSNPDSTDSTNGKPLNWTGFYLISGLYPSPKPELLRVKGEKVATIVLGPFHGLPACQAIPSIKGKGVCADGSSILPPTTIRVDKTDDYPGHIACDSLSRSELVIPLVVALSSLSQTHASTIQQANSSKSIPTDDDELLAWSGRGNGGEEVIIGLLDIDCIEEAGFDQEDQKALEECVRIIVDSCDW